jgi:hypothetical protein
VLTDPEGDDSGPGEAPSEWTGLLFDAEVLRQVDAHLRDNGWSRVGRKRAWRLAGPLLREIRFDKARWTEDRGIVSLRIAWGWQTEPGGLVFADLVLDESQNDAAWLPWINDVEPSQQILGIIERVLMPVANGYPTEQVLADWLASDDEWSGAPVGYPRAPTVGLRRCHAYAGLLAGCPSALSRQELEDALGRSALAGSGIAPEEIQQSVAKYLRNQAG